MTKPVVHFTSLLDRAAFEHLQSKTLLPSFSHYDVWLYEHAVGFTVAKMMDADLLSDVKSALEYAMQSGEPYHQFAKKLKPYLMAKGWWGEQVMTDPVDGVVKKVQLGSTRRLRVIFQTNMATAYAAGQWARVQEDKREFPYLKYIASTAEQKRASHMTYYGKIWHVDDPIWQSIFPPNGYGCQCTVRQLTAKQALRERGEDITKNPNRYTDQQKANHEQGVIDDGTDDIEWREFVNPRTGQKVKVPFDVTPTFAHNHGDRFDALQKLVQEKHGIEKVVLFERLLDDYLIRKINVENIKIADFSGIVAEVSRINELMGESSGAKVKDHEAIAAAQWEQLYQVQLQRFQAPATPKGEKDKPSPDFWIVGENVDKTTWETLDFWGTQNSKKINYIEFNRSINASPERIKNMQNGILHHFDKATISVFDLRHFTIQNRIQIISFVLSLPKKQRDRAVFIVGSV